MLHKCDNRACCNPAHLFLGTQLDNIKDREAKNRTAKGTMIKNHKFNEEQIRVMRLLRLSGISTIALSKQFNTSTGNVSDICNRHNWKHVE